MRAADVAMGLSRKSWATIFAALTLATLNPVIAATDPSSDPYGSGPPQWYSAAVHATVLAAGSVGVPLPEGVSLPGSVTFGGIRPGGWIISPNWCTANFVFNGSGSFDSGPYYLGTAKHCVQTVRPLTDSPPGSVGPTFDNDEELLGKPVVMAIITAPGAPLRLVQVGTVSHVSPGSAVVGSDVALIRIGCRPSPAGEVCDSSLDGQISPSMAHVGGPTSVHRDNSNQPIITTGHGLILGTGGNPRTGVISAYNPGFRGGYGYGMLLPAIEGDSGSPVRTVSGAAVGNLTQIGYNASYSPAGAFGTRVTYVEDYWKLKVVTCSSATPWPFLGCPSIGL